MKKLTAKDDITRASIILYTWARKFSQCIGKSGYADCWIYII